VPVLYIGHMVPKG